MTDTMSTSQVTAVPGQLSYLSEEERLSGIRLVLGEQRLNSSPLARVLAPLLVSLDWFGSPRNLHGQLPSDPSCFEREHLSALLQEIGFRLSVWQPSTRQTRPQPLITGTLCVAEDECAVYLGQVDGVEWWHDGISTRSDWQPPVGAQWLLVQRDISHTPLGASQPNWFSGLLALARREMTGIAWVSLVINLLALGVSLFTMTVYNRVIPSGTTDTLWNLAFAALLAVAGGWWLRLGRTLTVSQLGSWSGIKVGDAALRKTMGLSPEAGSRGGITSVMNRFRSLATVRTFVSGLTTGGMIDLPFVGVFLLVIALLGGWLVLVPMLGLLAFYLAAKLTTGYLRQRTQAASRASVRLQENVHAAVSRLRVLQGVSGHEVWMARLADLAVDAAEANKNVNLAMALVQSVGHSIGMLTVLATMATGITLVLEGVMNAGGLIATMMLIWRVTTPAQQVFLGAVRLQNARDSVQRIDQLMASVGELSNPQLCSPITALAPVVKSDRLFYRYQASSEPALNGISFDVAEGERVVVAGPNGAGKSTLLSCLAGIATPQNGRVMVGGRDIRQFDPADYRSWVGFLPQDVTFLPVIVKAFLSLGHIGVSVAEMEQELRRVAGERWWQLFGVSSAEQAFELTLIPDGRSPLQMRLRNVLGLVHALLGQPRLLLLDDPLNDEDPVLDARLSALLDQLHGKTTVIIATHRPEFIKAADKLAILDQGNLVYFGEVNKEEETELPSA
ncbi:ATP-binding cassette domain-containing protein [Aestuariicella sp. G3-2]|uniref:ATP-binding cassette domain-containing protein n=1 Tax=Pseudomaricurvus albidus TaxID=2842452 RepID=UPI001C0C6EC8|nr:ATP-binding cassette domain-containing protein [Aestuariicella albida]MBU3071101.1 ATP-binding cassette domain-containing protein [Aestuariicella albida]